MSGQTLFLGLETWSRLGGLQAFNRRLIAALARRAKGMGAPPVVAVLRRDAGAELPSDLHVVFHACGPSRAQFAVAAMAGARGAKLIVVGHINLLPVAALCRIRAPQARVVLMVHGDEVWGDPVYRAPRWLDRPLLRLVHRVVSVSDFTARRMQAAFALPPARFLTFLNAVDPIAFELPPRHAAPEILSVTRLAAHDHGKNIDQVLRAVAQLAPTRPSLRYTIVGEGVLRPGLQALAAELGISAQVTFAGRLSDGDLAVAYGRARIFVLPSQKEGFGIVYLEAWLRALPVICGTEDAAHEIVTDGTDGFCVNPQDTDLLAHRIGWLLDHPEAARQMGVAGQRKVADHYLADAFHDRLETILNEVERR